MHTIQTEKFFFPLRIAIFLILLSLSTACQQCKDGQELNRILTSITKKNYDIYFFTTTYSCAKCQISKINDQIQSNPDNKFAIVMFFSNSSPKVDTSGYDKKADIFFSKDMDALNYVSERAKNKLGSYMIKFENECNLKIKNI
jgi:hypothetical protein